MPLGQFDVVGIPTIVLLKHCRVLFQANINTVHILLLLAALLVGLSQGENFPSASSPGDETSFVLGATVSQLIRSQNSDVRHDNLRILKNILNLEGRYKNTEHLKITIIVAEYN